jgi:hypothetical protein
VRQVPAIIACLIHGGQQAPFWLFPRGFVLLAIAVP